MSLSQNASVPSTFLNCALCLAKESSLKGSIFTLHNWQSPYITLTQERFSFIIRTKGGNHIMKWDYDILQVHSSHIYFHARSRQYQNGNKIKQMSINF